MSEVTANTFPAKRSGSFPVCRRSRSTPKRRDPGRTFTVDEANDSMESIGTAERRRLAERLKPSLGYLLAAAGLIWVLHDGHPEKLLEGLIGVNWGLVAPALACDVLSYVFQGWRWRLLLRPVGEISTLRTT